MLPFGGAGAPAPPLGRQRSDDRPTVARIEGFSLHADVAVPARHRGRAAAGALSEPLELLERLAALVPPPRRPLLAYHGVLAPHGGWRAAIVPAAPSRLEDVLCRGQLGRSGLPHDAAVLDEGHPIGHTEHGVHLLLDEQDADPASSVAPSPSPAGDRRARA